MSDVENLIVAEGIKHDFDSDNNSLSNWDYDNDYNSNANDSVTKDDSEVDNGDDEKYDVF